LEEALILVVGRLVVVAGGEQQKWLHPFRLGDAPRSAQECVAL
jgi:hypothetical protein